MTNEELNRALYEKMQAEMQEYTDWLKGLPTEDILNHTYEYTVRQDILFAFEDFDFSDAECKALLKSPCPLRDVFDRYNTFETGYVEDIRLAITEEARENLHRDRERDSR